MDKKSGQKPRRTTLGKWGMDLFMVKDVDKFNNFAKN